eukprot:scaffold48828_cov75-Cyclotella_meneghiniana.AAC.10
MGYGLPSFYLLFLKTRWDLLFSFHCKITLQHHRKHHPSSPIIEQVEASHQLSPSPASRYTMDYSKWDNLSDSDSDGSTGQYYENDPDLDHLTTRMTQQFALGGSMPRDHTAAETELLKRGVPYAKDDSSKVKWLLVGVKKNIKIHPADEGVANYSNVIFEEDPDTFVPDRSKYKDGRVLKWGLKDPATVEDDIAAFMSATIHRNDNIQLYSRDNDIGDPHEQFIDFIIARRDKYILSDEVTAAMKFTYVLLIELCHCEKYVWRRVRVPSGIELRKFHDQVICPVMGWSRGYHGYAFEDPNDGVIIGPQKYGSYMDTMHVPMHYIKVMDDKGYPLAGLLREKGDIAYYNYDLGDNWIHRIVLESIVQEETSVTLIDGKGACPPEDSNGLEGKGCISYAEFLKLYKKNPKKTEMKKAVKEASRSINYSKPWMGTPIPFKPLEFNIAYHRTLLRRMLDGPAVKTSKGSFPSAEEGNKYEETFDACHNCGDRLKPLVKCTRCRKVSYCGKECQVANWKDHKAECNYALFID